MHGVDDIANDLFKEMEQAPEEIPEMTSAKEEPSPHENQSDQDIDALLPKTPQIVRAKPFQRPKLREWAHVIDVNQEFTDFHSLVPVLAFQVEDLYFCDVTQA